MCHRLWKNRVSDQWASVLLRQRFSVAVSNTCGVTVAGLEPDLKEGWVLLGCGLTQCDTNHSLDFHVSKKRLNDGIWA